MLGEVGREARNAGSSQFVVDCRPTASSPHPQLKIRGMWRGAGHNVVCVCRGSKPIKKEKNNARPLKVVEQRGEQLAHSKLS